MVIISNSPKKNREVIVAPASGICRGVQLAIDKALQSVKNFKQGHVFLEGELVHNHDVQKQLYARGIRLLQPNSQVQQEDAILIRAHGVSPQRRLFLKCYGCQVVDCTCPSVQRIAHIIEFHKNHPIILLGDHHHAEVEGLMGFSENVHVCENVGMFLHLEKEFFYLGNRRLSQNQNDFQQEKSSDWILVCQSTLDVSFLEAVGKICYEKRLPIKIFDTICAETKRRQLGLEILYQCDAVIVIGGFHSANTKRLFEKVKKHVANVFWIEDVDGLAKCALDAYQKIGITAGASTPKDVLQKIHDLVMAG